MEQLRRLRDEITRGRRAGEAADLVGSISVSSSGTTTSFVRRFIEGSNGFDTGDMRRTLDEATAALGVEQAVAEVALPAMREVGLLWQLGRCDVANEHLATDGMRAWLSRLRVFASAPLHRGPLVLACGPTDLHSIGLESFAVLLAYRGWDCRVLGAITPVASLLQATRSLSATGVVVTSHRAVTRRAAIEALREVSSTHTASCFYAGAGFTSPSSRQGLPGTYLGEDLIRALDVLQRTIEAEVRLPA